VLGGAGTAGICVSTLPAKGFFARLFVELASPFDLIQAIKTTPAQLDKSERQG
jgi:hypothetical protein